MISCETLNSYEQIPNQGDLRLFSRHLQHSLHRRGGGGSTELRQDIALIQVWLICVRNQRFSTWRAKIIFLKFGTIQPTKIRAVGRGGGGVTRSKFFFTIPMCEGESWVRRMKRGKVYCLQLPPDAPARTATILTPHENQPKKDIKLNFLQIFDFSWARISFNFQTLESTRGKTRGGSRSWNRTGHGAQVGLHLLSLEMVSRYVKCCVWCRQQFEKSLLTKLSFREREGLAGENTRLRHRWVPLLLLESLSLSLSTWSRTIIFPLSLTIFPPISSHSCLSPISGIFILTPGLLSWKSTPVSCRQGSRVWGTGALYWV